MGEYQPKKKKGIDFQGIFIIIWALCMMYLFYDILTYESPNATNNVKVIAPNGEELYTFTHVSHINTKTRTIIYKTEDDKKALYLLPDGVILETNDVKIK